jgi:hypothetical protein
MLWTDKKFTFVGPLRINSPSAKIGNPIESLIGTIEEQHRYASQFEGLYLLLMRETGLVVVNVCRRPSSLATAMRRRRVSHILPPNAKAKPQVIF